MGTAVNWTETWTPLLLIAGVMLTVRYGMPERGWAARAISAVLAMLCTLRYLYWRLLFAVPQHQPLLAQTWAYIFLAAEVASAASTLLVYFFLSRTMDRSPQADARKDSPLHDAPVDILVVTYNESEEILERTLVGALAVHHRDLRVWLLDDGARPWARALADELGVQYVPRVKGKHAKAGNINHGLQYVLDTQHPGARKPEFLLLLDADFVPSPQILRRTLGLFEEQDVGIVQTPQHFFNYDPVQANLLCARVWPDEQRFFFNVQLPGRDAWGVAFCCGTSAVIRTEALVAAGGFATETVTEDMLTTFKLQEHGYRTVFLNERLSLGLASESLREYVAQRSRWCLGAVQQIYTRYSFWGSARLRLRDRVAFFDSVLYWVANAGFKLLVWAAPAVYWWTGAFVIRGNTDDLICWLLPSIAANLMFMRFYANNRVLPILTDVSQLMSATTILRTVAHGLVRPFGHGFRVTAKGIPSEGMTIHWNLLWPFATIAAMTATGMLLHLSTFSPGHGTQGFSLNLIWSVVAVAVMSLAMITCIEQPRRRAHQRFDAHEEGMVLFPDGAECGCTVWDISTGGAQVQPAGEWPEGAAAGSLLLDQGRLRVEFSVVRGLGERIAIRFAQTAAARRGLILKLYTGRYTKEVEEIRLRSALRSLTRTLTSL